MQDISLTLPRFAAPPKPEFLPEMLASLRRFKHINVVGRRNHERFLAAELGPAESYRVCSGGQGIDEGPVAVGNDGADAASGVYPEVRVKVIAPGKLH